MVSTSLTLSPAHTHTELILWQYNPRASKCFAFASLDQQELFSVTSTSDFQVWLDFIRFVVLPLLSRGRFPHQQTHQKSYTRRTRPVDLRFKSRGPIYFVKAHVVCFCFTLLISKRNWKNIFVGEHFDFQPA